MLSLSDGFLVKVSPQLPAAANLPGHLLTCNGRQLLGPAEANLWPFLDSVRWHRRHRFRAR